MPFIIDGKSAQQGYVPSPGDPPTPQVTPLPGSDGAPSGPSQKEFEAAVKLADALQRAEEEARAKGEPVPQLSGDSALFRAANRPAFRR